MKKFLLPLLFAVLSAAASAQTTTTLTLQSGQECSYLGPLYCPGAAFVAEDGGYAYINLYGNLHSMIFYNTNLLGSSALTQNVVYTNTQINGGANYVLQIQSFSSVDYYTGKTFSGTGLISYHKVKPAGFRYPIYIIDSGSLTITTE